MKQTEAFLKELKNESVTTRKMLSIVPDDKFDWQPHPKSMTIKRLAAHIAELPGWVGMALNTTELDFQNNPYQPKDINTTKELLVEFENNVADGIKQFENANEDQLSETWVLRNGDQILSTGTKADIIRISLSQIIHHRAQLGVFLRLLDIPIPGSYGPSADETF
ncbi:DinB family protein [Albibacterium bauzanense]|uniref:Putative damage-inducible protein DinB n=1 Tax=Albibacterium bauzanense TaxID=653929 RepID=A0A4R1M0C7_9SPHI|nr:DinB family protein [Albibacterium bauzanense]TCK85065.1 putative damage-inducible protein DinB [Albibacterium bauzanense]